MYVEEIKDLYKPLVVLLSISTRVPSASFSLGTGVYHRDTPVSQIYNSPSDAEKSDVFLNCSFWKLAQYYDNYSLYY